MGGLASLVAKAATAARALLSVVAKTGALRVTISVAVLSTMIVALAGSIGRNAPSHR